VARRHLEIIERSGMQLNRLIDDLLQFNVHNSQAANLLQRPVDLAALIQQLAELGRMLATPRHNHFQVGASPDLPAAVVMDEQRLLQVLQNLIGNACKYTSDGQIRFSIAHDTEPAAAQPSGQCRLRFEVADTGIGIATEDQHRIFEAFQRGEGAQALPGLGWAWAGPGEPVFVCADVSHSRVAAQSQPDHSRDRRDARPSTACAGGR
jgi:signal transduction histidine kinase